MDVQLWEIAKLRCSDGDIFVARSQYIPFETEFEAQAYADAKNVVWPKKLASPRG
jgi:hypothetical protein